MRWCQGSFWARLQRSQLEYITRNPPGKMVDTIGQASKQARRPINERGQGGHYIGMCIHDN